MVAVVIFGKVSAVGGGNVLGVVVDSEKLCVVEIDGFDSSIVVSSSKEEDIVEIGDNQDSLFAIFELNGSRVVSIVHSNLLVSRWRNSR